MAKITPALIERAQGVCEHCGKAPDFRGLQRVHIEYKSQGGKNTLGNVQLWCCPCHYGKDGHRTEMEKV